MGFYERLMDLEDPRIPVHAFMAVVAEFKRGRLTQPQAVALLGLSAPEQTEAAALITRVTNNLLTAIEIHDVLLLAEGRYAGYDTVALVKTRLGV
jgi:hypothetical protein